MSGLPYSSNVSPRWSLTNLVIGGAFGESRGNRRLVVLGLKVMDRLALDDVKPKDSGEAQVAEGALLGSAVLLLSRLPILLFLESVNLSRKVFNCF